MSPHGLQRAGGQPNGGKLGKKQRNHRASNFQRDTRGRQNDRNQSSAEEECQGRDRAGGREKEKVEPLVEKLQADIRIAYDVLLGGWENYLNRALTEAEMHQLLQDTMSHFQWLFDKILDQNCDSFRDRGFILRYVKQLWRKDLFVSKKALEEEFPREFARIGREVQLDGETGIEILGQDMAMKFQDNLALKMQKEYDDAIYDFTEQFFPDALIDAEVFELDGLEMKSKNRDNLLLSDRCIDLLANRVPQFNKKAYRDGAFGSTRARNRPAHEIPTRNEKYCEDINGMIYFIETIREAQRKGPFTRAKEWRIIHDGIQTYDLDSKAHRAKDIVGLKALLAHKGAVSGFKWRSENTDLEWLKYFWSREMVLYGWEMRGPLGDAMNDWIEKVIEGEVEDFPIRFPKWISLLGVAEDDDDNGKRKHDYSADDDMQSKKPKISSEINSSKSETDEGSSPPPTPISAQQDEAQVMVPASQPLKSQGSLEYLCIDLPAPEINQILDVAFASSKTSLFRQLEQAGHIENEFRITLMHRASANKNTLLWNALSMLHAQTISKSPDTKIADCRVQLDQIVWDDHIMVIVVTLEEKWTQTNHMAHIVVGSKGPAEVKPEESEDLVRRWMEGKAGCKASALKKGLGLDGVVKCVWR